MCKRTLTKLPRSQVKLSGTHLAQQVYALITYIQAAQAQLLHDLSAVGKGKGKKKGAATKGLDHVGKVSISIPL